VALQPFAGGSVHHKVATCTQDNTNTEQTHTFQVGFEPMIPVFVHVKAVHALDYAAIVIGNNASTQLIKNIHIQILFKAVNGCFRVLYCIVIRAFSEQSYIGIHRYEKDKNV
jgi:hypothetical protein